MYAEYWGLVDTPFANLVDTRWFYESPVHEEALARLLFLVEQHRCCGVLFGPAGTGKSLLLEILARQVRRTQRQCAVIDLLGRSGHELLWELNAALGLVPAAGDSPLSLWRNIQDYLRTNRSANVQTVVLFDHLERAAADCWGTLERLIRLQSHADQWTTILIAVRSEQLSPPLAPRLREVSDLRVELPPLDRDGCHQYVERLLARAGGAAGIFEPAALDRLFEASQGLPRELNRLCDLCLLATMAEGASHVREPAVTSAQEDLQSLNQPRTTSRMVPARF